MKLFTEGANAIEQTSFNQLKISYDITLVSKACNFFKLLK